MLAVVSVLVLLGVGAATIGAISAARTDVQNERLAFRAASGQVAASLKLALQHEEDLVSTASAYVAANRHLTGLGFARWVESLHVLKRYPELENIGLVVRVPASGLAAFNAQMARNPLYPFGSSAPPLSEPKQVPQSGTAHGYLCLAQAGLARNTGVEIPPGLDYCAVAPALEPTRLSGEATYAGFSGSGKPTLGVETPVYSSGLIPPRSERAREFIGWLGELINPKTVLDTALVGHPNMAVQLSNTTHGSSISALAGQPPRGAQVDEARFSKGWIVRTFGPATASGVFGDGYATMLLLGGVALTLSFCLVMLVLATERQRALTLVREKTRELSHQAMHDGLTGLPNRALVTPRAPPLLPPTTRDGGAAGALFIDIDSFKDVNDSLGHAAGDQLLVTVGERLSATVRERDTVGRLGGDEFVVLVECERGNGDLYVLAERLNEVLREPVELDDGRRISLVTASIGIAAGHYNSPDEMLRDADLALYAAKGAGKDRFELFSPDMKVSLDGRRELQADLSAALPRQQFRLDYQPVFDLREHLIVGVEALIRWDHPERGVLAPDQFIPLAEASGMIVPIGHWVLERACSDAASWHEAGTPIDVAVNVSAYQLNRRGFADDVRECLEASGLPAASLVLEITETVLMRDAFAACEQLEQLRALGVRVAIDDFGTGYASLSHLQRVPVDVLKIDRSFIAGLDRGEEAREILAAILGVGRALSLDVIAEGVESGPQLETITALGCPMAQGFLLGRPVGADEIAQLLSLRPMRARSASVVVG
jgi:diguanylate cyclase (GGDEF)-like protein